MKAVKPEELSSDQGLEAIFFKMNMCQKILFPSLIDEGTSRMSQRVQRKILRTSTYMQMRNAEMNSQTEDKAVHSSFLFLRTRTTANIISSLQVTQL